MTNTPGRHCVATSTTTGQPCGRYAAPGATVCASHGARAPHVAANAAVRAELARWTLGDPVDDPGHTLLRLITQSRMRAETYAAELDRIVNSPDAPEYLTDVLVQPQMAVSGTGRDAQLVQVGEYIRQIAVLEGQERDRCARFCQLAIQAGLAERMVRVAEKQGEMVAAAVRAALGELELDDEMRRAVMAGVGRHLRAVGA